MGTFSSLPADAISAVRVAPAFRPSVVVEGVRGPHVQVGGRELLSFCSTDYLGLAQRPELREAAHRAAGNYGWGSGSSRILSGTTRCHSELEERLALFLDVEAALVLPSGYTANLAALPVLADSGSVLLIDERCHPSLWEGARLSGGTIEAYRHAAVDEVVRLLRKHSSAKRVVVTDGLFGLDGDLAPLRELYGLARFHGAELLVDDAHGMGILGGQGRGTWEHFGLRDRLRIQTGTLSKAVGASGGYVAGPRAWVEKVRSEARAFLFTAAPPAAACAAAQAGIELLAGASAERSQLRRNSEHLSRGLRELGGEPGGGATPVFCWRAGSSAAVTQASRILEAEGILLPAVVPPAVSEEQSRLRITVTAMHEGRDIDRLLQGLGRLRP